MVSHIIAEMCKNVEIVSSVLVADNELVSYIPQTLHFYASCEMRVRNFIAANKNDMYHEEQNTINRRNICHLLTCLLT